jgi:predicted nucleic acid-binding protein
MATDDGAVSNAVNLYGQVLDKSWSITDCVSFQIMRAERISAALTSDRHFAQAGFEVLLAG